MAFDVALHTLSCFSAAISSALYASKWQRDTIAMVDTRWTSVERTKARPARMVPLAVT